MEYIYDGILYNHKKEWNLVITTCMNLEDNILSEVNKEQKQK